MSLFKNIGIWIIALLALSGCAQQLSESGLQRPQITAAADVMDAPLSCLAQQIYDQDGPRFDKKELRKIAIRIGKIPDRSGKTTANAPSDNPPRLQSYFQSAWAHTGLFDLLSIDDGGTKGDLPIPPNGRAHAATDYQANFLFQGALDGDSDLHSENADAQLTIGPFQFLASARQRHVTQRLYVELVNSNDGSVISTEVSDPYSGGVTRRVHLTFAAEIQLPETSGSWGINYTIPGSGDGGTAGGTVRANLNRPQALHLAAKAMVFEILRRMMDSYAESERCITPDALAYVKFPKRIQGLVVSPSDIAKSGSKGPSTPARYLAQVPQASIQQIPTRPAVTPPVSAPPAHTLAFPLAAQPLEVASNQPILREGTFIRRTGCCSAAYRADAVCYVIPNPHEKED